MADGRMGYELRGHEGKRDHCFIKIPTSWPDVDANKCGTVEANLIFLLPRYYPVQVRAFIILY